MRGRAQAGTARRRVTCAALGVALVVGSLGGCARRAPPGVILPEPRGGKTPRDLSRTGRDRGDIEIGLGAVTTAVAATLVVLGAVGIKRTLDLRAYCTADRPPTFVPDPVREASCTAPLGFDPVRGGFISSGLAFAFAVPIAVGGGFLLRKGVTMRKDFKNKEREAVRKSMSLRPWLNGQGAGLGLNFRF